MQGEGQRGDAEQDVEIGGGDDDAPHDENIRLKSDVTRRWAGHDRREIAQDQQQPNGHQHGADGGLHRIAVLERPSR